MRRTCAAGVTLLELVVAMSLLAVVAGIAATTLHAAHRNDTVAAAYAEDLRRLRSALDAVSADVREAAAVRAEGTVLHVDGVTWELRDDVLFRDAAPVARGVCRFTASDEEHGIVRIGVAPAPRTSGVRSPMLETRVRPRAAVVR